MGSSAARREVDGAGVRETAVQAGLAVLAWALRALWACLSSGCAEGVEARKEGEGRKENGRGRNLVIS